VSRWNYNAHATELKDSTRLVARLRKQCPEVIEEWTKADSARREQGRLHLQKHGVFVPADAGLVTIGPITIRHLNLFAYKMALGLFFDHFQAPLPNTGLISAIWRTKEDFAKLGIPQELLEIMPRYSTLQQGKWDTSEDFEYRFDVNTKDGLIGCFARLRTGLYVTAFAIANENLLPQEDRTSDWIRAQDLLTILERPEFSRRLQ